MYMYIYIIHIIRACTYICIYIYVYKINICMPFAAIDSVSSTYC